MAVYYATKAYVLSFSESLHEELKGKGVTVTALAGPTESRFADRSKMRGTRAFKQLRVMDPAEVAQQGYDALMGGERVRVPGAQNKAIVAATRVGTAAMRAKLSKKTLERK
jgi:short-subunit dehydrogenase